MTPERWQQVKGVLQNVLEIAPPQRAAFLDRTCEGDASLRREVESLLAAGDKGRSSFLQSPPTMRLSKGTRLGDYEIQSLLGVGGMGEVYRACDPRLRRDVAIKVLPSFVSSDPERLRRFEQEATAAAALNHPNILAVYQMGTHESAPYMVSELLEGETLREQIRRGRLAVRKAIDYAVQIARGLAAAHEKGIVHRDLKPENLFVTKDGRLKILDFGLAKLTKPQRGSEHSASTLGDETEPGVVMGTVGYMAPEQVRGQAADHRADIFAFGAILYEMLSGKRAFQKPTSPETMTAILNEDPPGISQVVPNLPPALQRVVHRCFEKNPEQRFQSASDLAFALEALSDSRPVVALVHSGPRVSRRGVAAAVGGLAVLLALLMGLSRGKLREWLRTPVGAPRIESLAVLPLQNLSHDSEQDYLADGITDELIADLSKISALRVISRTSTMQYKDAHKSVPQIAKELNVDGIVEGSVQRSGDHVRISAELIYGASDMHVWAEAYDRQLRDVLGLQGEVAGAIANAVNVKLRTSQQTSLKTVHSTSPEAQDAYLRGRYWWNKRTREGEFKGLEFFQKAIELDPGYGAAYAGMADSYLVLAHHGRLSPLEAMPRARASAIQAIQLDNSLAEAHNSLALVHLSFDWDYSAAAAEFQNAIALNPNYATAHHWFAHYLAVVGRDTDAMREIQKARELDPFSVSINSFLVLTFYFAHQNDRALQAAKQMAEIDPAFRGEAEGLQGEILAAEGVYEEAVTHWNKALVLSGQTQDAATLQHAYAIGGYRGYLGKQLQMLRVRSQHEYVAPLEFAELYARLGDRDSAFDWLERAYSERSSWLNFVNTNPLYDSLRSDPRYADLLHRIGLPQ
jgi:eukaryotic-like serine/threonine-protein kinase